MRSAPLYGHGDFREGGENAILQGQTRGCPDSTTGRPAAMIRACREDGSTALPTGQCRVLLVYWLVAIFREAIDIRISILLLGLCLLPLVGAELS